MKKIDEQKEQNGENEKKEPVQKLSRIKFLIAVCLILLFVLIVINIMSESNTIKSLLPGSKSNAVQTDAEQVQTSEQVLSYEQEQKTSLINILKQMDGVGDVDVMISFANGEEKVVAYDNTAQNSTTQESDTQGGTRVNNQNNDNQKVVMTQSGSSNEPFVTTVKKPEILGIIVVAEGADNSKTKYEIEQAVSKLYNLSLDKVNVYSKKK